MRITVESSHGMRLDDGGGSSLWRRGQYDVVLTSLTTAVLGDAGVLVLTGDPGTGKTAVLHALTAEVQPRGVVVGRLLYPVLESVDFLSGIAEAFGLPGGFTTVAEFEDAFERFAASVAAHGGRLLLMIDDAHSLPRSSVREVRRLARHRWDDGRARLSVILAGDDALSAAVRASKIEPTVAVQLHPLTREESAQFIAHLLRAADGVDPAAFTPQMLEQLCRESRGIPHVITVLVSRAIAKTRLNERRLVGEVVSEVPPAPPSPVARPQRSFAVPRSVAAAAAVLVVVAAAAGAGWYTRSGHGPRPAAADGESPVTTVSVTPVTEPPRAAPAPAPAQTSSPVAASPLPVHASPHTTSAERPQASTPVADGPPDSVKAARTESVPSAVQPARPAPAAAPSDSVRGSVDTPARRAPRVLGRATAAAAPRDAEKVAVRRDRADVAEARAAQAPSEESRSAARPTRSGDDHDPGAIIDWAMKGR